MIDENGRFVLSTKIESDGATVGPQQISVVCHGETPPGVQGPDQEFAVPVMRMGASLIPMHYTDHMQSGLTFEVREDQKNEVKIELK